MSRLLRASLGLGCGFLSASRLLQGGSPSSNEAAPARDHRPLVVCGPSGVGKGTLISMLLNDYPGKVGFSVSHTTRKPRPGEVNGVHYHFVEKPEMEEMIRQGKFVEYANVHGNLYGTSKKSIQDVAKAGKVCILDIDVQGAKSVAHARLGAYFIFVQPPTFKDLESRLRQRGTESEEKIQLRLKNAKEELAAVNLSIWHRRLVNDNLSETYRVLKADVEKFCML